jgi:hypothetical protein
MEQEREESSSRICLSYRDVHKF